MSCARYRDLISRFLDDALAPRERQQLLAHLEQCADCAATLARYRQAGVLVGRLPEGEPAPRVRQAVLANISRPAVVRRRVPAAVATGVMATALAVGVAASALAPGHPAAVPPGTAATPGVKADSEGDNQVLIDFLRRSLGPAEAAALPGYLPRGARVERLSLGRPAQAGGPYEVDLDLRLEDGNRLVVRQRASEAKAAGPTPAARTVLVGGREWRYLPRNPGSAREAASNVLAGEVNGRRYELESTLPLADLVRIAESIR